MISPGLPRVAIFASQGTVHPLRLSRDPHSAQHCILGTQTTSRRPDADGQHLGAPGDSEGYQGLLRHRHQHSERGPHLRQAGERSHEAGEVQSAGDGLHRECDQAFPCTGTVDASSDM